MHLSTRRDRSYLSHWRICTYIIYLHSHKTTRGMSFDCLLIRLRPRGIVVLTNACIHARMYDDEPESDAHKCPAGTHVFWYTWTQIIFHLFRGRGRWVICESVSTSMMLQLGQQMYLRIGIQHLHFLTGWYMNKRTITYCGDQNFLFNLNRIWL